MKPIKYLLDLIFPPKCVFCNKVLKDGSICATCERELPYTAGDAVSQKLPFIERCVAPLYYEGNVRESVLRYKFFGNQAYSARYGEIMSVCIDKELDCGSIDVVSWVPLSKKRLRKRGYDQAKLLADEISHRLSLEESPLLIKTGSNKVQSKTKNAAERSRNVSGMYRIADGAHVSGKTVLLVDDVVTTGSTLSECARMLRKAGAAKIYCAAIARHRD